MLRVIDRNAHEQIISDLTEESRSSLFSQLNYLATYADDSVSSTQMAPCIVYLYPNSTLKEYSVQWERLDKQLNTYMFWMYGGLVMDRSGNWSVHT